MSYQTPSAKPMKPMIDRQRDLVGATPEKLARALLRPLRTLGGGSGPRARVETVVGNERPVEKVAPDKARDRVPHLSKRS